MADNDLKLVLENAVSKEDFIKSFERILEVVLRKEKALEEAVARLEQTYQALIKKADSDHSSNFKALKDQTNQLFVGEQLKKMDSDSKSMFSTLKSELLKSFEQKVKDVDFKVSSIKPIKGDRGERGVPGPMPTEHLELLKETKEELRKMKDILSNRSRGWLGSGQSVIVPRPLSNITPSGSINGVNKDFTLPKEPKKDGERVYLNGVRMQSGTSNDYTVLGRIITFNTAPLTNDKILVDIDF